MMVVTRGESDFSFVVSQFTKTENEKDLASVRVKIDLAKLYPDAELEKFIKGGEVNIGEEEVFKITRKDDVLVLTSPESEVFSFRKQ